MDWYFFVKTLHIISATVLFGTGMGIAFFMFCSHFTIDLHQKYFAAKFTVLADYIFTLPAVIVQPVTGIWLIYLVGYDYSETWLIATYVIYLIAGICWIPVVWIQLELKIILARSLENDEPLPPRYRKLFRIWFILGWPAFIGLVVVFFLMVLKPV